MCAFAAACGRSDGNGSNNDKIVAKLDAIEKRLDLLEKRQPAARPAPPRPDPNLAYFLPVTAGDSVRGAAQAKVTIVEAFDFACPYCARTAPVLEQILDKYKDSVRVVSKYYVVHADTATLPALAACAAHEQGKAAAMEKGIWAAAWKLDPPPNFDATKLGQASLEAIAKDAGLNMDKFRSDMSGDTCKQMLARQSKEVTAVGVNGTPWFFVNGHPYVGARTLEGFSAVVDAEIQKADAALKGGVKPEDYYATLMASAKKSL
jgi:protein-disulfide isomerase